MSRHFVDVLSLFVNVATWSASISTLDALIICHNTAVVMSRHCKLKSLMFSLSLMSRHYCCDVTTLNVLYRFTAKAML